MRSRYGTRPSPAACLLLALLSATAPAAAQTARAAQADLATTGRGAPDPCAVVNEAAATAIAGVPMQHRGSEPAMDAVRSCTYYGKAPSGGGAMLLRVVTYRCIACEPAELVRHMEQNKWGSARFQHEPELGPLTTSLVTAAGAQVMGFKGRTGLTVYLGARSPGLLPLARRGYATAITRLP